MAYPQISLRLENELDDDLEHISLAVRMKLDLAGCKISLRDWQAIPLQQRCELHEINADSDKAIKRFRRMLEDALRQARRPSPRRLQALGSAQVRDWKDPAELPNRIAELDDSRELTQDWARFKRFDRYVLWSLAVEGDLVNFRAALQALRATSTSASNQRPPWMALGVSAPS
ncbi:MAG: nitrate reductase associated protein [Gammaproteobacteria bacterium]